MTATPERVLLVDDVAEWTQIATRLLLQHDEIGAVEIASSLEDAITALAEFRPTVVIADVRLGPDDADDWSGLEVCRIAREADLSVGLVVMSGFSRAALP